MAVAAEKRKTDRRLETTAEAKKLFEESLVWDMTLPWVPTANAHDVDIILPEMRRLGVKFVSLTMSDRDWLIGETTRHIAEVRRSIFQRGDWLALCTTVPQIREAMAAGKLAVGLHFQETMPFHESLAMVEAYHTLGIRHALLAYNQKNFVADGCAERTDAGLSRFGVALVKEMIRVGIIVDGSHSGYRSTMEAIELCGAAGAPFIFSHSNPDQRWRHYRNIKDDQIKGAVATGGMVGINGVGDFVGDNDASSEGYFGCIDYAVQLVGPEHVGFGLDFVRDLEPLRAWVRRNAEMWPANQGKPIGEPDFVQPAQLIEVTALMLEHGYKKETVKGILGENWARVCGKVWK